MDYLPNNKTIFLGIAIAIFIGWLFWVPTTSTFQENNLELEENIKKQANQQKLDVLSQIDSDNDGLKDWEEYLWKTDPNNPDTDGDGTSDGDEIVQKRNPLIAGPDDELKELSDALRDELRLKYEEGQNLTGYIAKEFLINYFDLKAKGVNTKEILPQMLLEKTKQSIQGQEEFSINDIIIKQDNSKYAIKKYVNDSGRVLEDNFADIEEHDLIILQRALEGADYNLLDDLSSHILAYNETASDLKTVAVPAILSDAHLNLINGLNYTKKTLEAIQKMEKDPFLALNGMEEYFNAAEQIKAAFASIKYTIKQNDVSILPSESGYIFIR